MDHIPHGFLDGVIVVFLFVLSIIINALRSTLSQSRDEQKELSKAINTLSLTIGRDYVTRAEVEKTSDELWSTVNKTKEDVSSVSNRVTRIESQRHDGRTPWRQEKG